MSTICKVENLQKSYGAFNAVNDVSIDIEKGEFVVFLGPSGCGKTTTLRMIAGLENPTEGKILIDRRTVFSAKEGIFVKPEHRDIGMVFQSYAIWPHMTVFENIAYPLRTRRLPKADIALKVKRAIELVGLDQAADRSAVALSGGQMQRVSLARALVYNPTLLLFDEPLSNLDLKLRVRLRSELKELQRNTGITSIYVTHDQEEAVELADRIVVMSQGKIMQTGSPEELYRRPQNKFVADFISSANLIEGTIVKDAASGEIFFESGHGGRIKVTNGAERQVGKAIHAVLHPEDCLLLAHSDDPNGLKIKVTRKRYQGTSTRYYLDWNGTSLEALVLGTESPFSPGDTVTLVVRPESIVTLDK